MQLESAAKTANNVNKELTLLQETLSNIQKARPIEDLTVQDVLIACPEIEKKVEKMVENGQWSVPGYKEVFFVVFFVFILIYPRNLET